ncbi:MAG: PIG-L family deacetylase [candidate division WOR-3 bacterium]|nr:PIG-L family deacetylase [candidate division WOR-3 bacterium]
MHLLPGCFDRVLVIAPHTDDEFGCAGTVVRLIEEEAHVHYLAFSSCEESVPDGFPKDVLVGECRSSTAALGIAPGNVEILSFRVRHFPHERQQILEKLVAVGRQNKPDLVLLPSSLDIHQDHHTVYSEGLRAFKHSTILGYELPQNLVSFNNSAFVALEERHLTTKMKALSCYRSQSFRSYSREEFVRGLAGVRGVQCGAKFAEAFEVIRLIVG